MKIPINLASQPFRRDRAMLVASIAVTVVLMGTLGILIWLGMQDRAQLADVRREVSHLKSQIGAASAEEARLESVVRRPENAEVLERSVFINTLLYRKGISWTRIFSDLEKVLPYNVRIIQVRPTVNAQNHVVLDMQVGSQEPEPEIQLLKALETSPLFGAVLEHTSQPPSQSEPLYKYRITVNYAQKL